MKALGMLSGGLDSMLAIKLVREQGIKVDALFVRLPFAGCALPESVSRFAKEEQLKLHVIDCTKGVCFKQYIELVRHPKMGYGSGMNPCKDCRGFMLSKAKGIAKRIGASFIFTGEVLGERPMSQMRGAMNDIEEQTGLKGKLVRPLSAKLLPETEAERNGWIDRSKLYDFQGRSRKPQIKLAKQLRLTEWPNPAGGCVLCEKDFARRLKDLLEHNSETSYRDIQLLRIGRHFRVGNSKIIVGRNELENQTLKKLKGPEEIGFEVNGTGSPLTILQGNAIIEAAKLTARYSDATGDSVKVDYGKQHLSVEQATQNEIGQWRL